MGVLRRTGVARRGGVPARASRAPATDGCAVPRPSSRPRPLRFRRFWRAARRPLRARGVPEPLLQGDVPRAGSRRRGRPRGRGRRPSRCRVRGAAARVGLRLPADPRSSVPRAGRARPTRVRGALGRRPRAAPRWHRAGVVASTRRVTVSDYDVFDVHHHVGRAFDALGGELADEQAALGHDFARVELEDRLRIMDEGGVHQALVIPGHGYLRPNGIADTRRVNDEIAAYRDATPERFPAACGIVEPRDGPAALAEIDRVKDDLGLVAISFHTRFQGVSMDSQWIVRYLERMRDVGLVPLVHAMDDTPEEALWKLASIARRLPDLTIVALDPFSRFEATRQCFHVAEIAPNVVFDTSLSYNFDFIEDF